MHPRMTATATMIQENPFLIGDVYYPYEENPYSIHITKYVYSLKKSARDKIEELSNDYNILNLEEISNYLTINTEIVSILEEGVDYIKKHFGNNYERLTLSLIHDPEIANENNIVVDISTKLSTTEALKRLDDFDECWWLNKAEEIDDNLIFNLDFI